MYDVKPLFEKLPIFKLLVDDVDFNEVCVDTGGYGIVWKDDR